MNKHKRKKICAHCAFNEAVEARFPGWTKTDKPHKDDKAATEYIITCASMVAVHVMKAMTPEHQRMFIGRILIQSGAIMGMYTQLTERLDGVPTKH